MEESRMSANEIASVVSKSPNLVSLDLRSTKVDDDGIVAISALRHLVVLDLAYCLSFSSIDPLLKCQRLKVLNVNYTNVGDDGSQWSHSFQALRKSK